MQQGSSDDSSESEGYSSSGSASDASSASAASARWRQRRVPWRSDSWDRDPLRNKDEWRKAANDRQRGLWQLLDGVIAGRRRRSKVDPAEGLEPLQFRIKGSLMYEDNDDRLPLCVMNTAGAMQPAHNFLQYMQQVFGEALALRDAIMTKFPRGPDEWDYDEGLWNIWTTSMTPPQIGYSCAEDSLFGMAVGHLAVPGPLMRALGDVVDPYFLRDLGDERARFEAKWLRLVISKLEPLAGVPYLFNEFFAVPVLPGHDELAAVMKRVGRSFGERNCSNTIDEFTVTIRQPSDESGYQAEGCLATCKDGVSWAVGHKMEFRRRGWDKREEDYW